jgi:hypothetical protein
VGLPWSQHVAFLDNRRLRHEIIREVIESVGKLADHPAVLMFAIGNEIPPGIVRWHGHARIERFLRTLYHRAKDIAPDALFTYVNFPPTEFLDLSFFDVCAFNVYLHREPELTAYLARLQHIAGHKPLLLAEAGADSIREGEDGQAAITSMHIRAASAKAHAARWRSPGPTNGGEAGSTCTTGRSAWSIATGSRSRRRQRSPKRSPTRRSPRSSARRGPAYRWSSVPTTLPTRSRTTSSRSSQLTYPDFEIIWSTTAPRSDQRDRSRAPAGARHRHSNGGLSAARNVGLAGATGEIVAYTDADTRVDRDWLTFLVQPFLTRMSSAPADRTSCRPTIPPIAQCIARAPAARPTCCSTIASPSTCPAATWRSAASAARDRRLQSDLPPRRRRCGRVLAAAGARLEDRLRLAALVWHHHRSS